MPVVQINQNGETSFRRFKQGESLQSVLAEQSLIHSPCGGKGTCGKCQVNVVGKGEVLACTFYPKTHVVVNLASNRKSQILSQNSSSIISSSPNKEVTHSHQEYGLAIDIGTTSVVFYWVNLRSGNIDQVRGVENPQVSYGADVITRINKCSDAKVLKTLQKLMVNLIGDELERFIINDLSLKKMSVSANACMLHILAGVNPMPMAFAPFVAPFTEAKSIKAKELGLQLKSEVFVELLPSASAFVGADIVSGITSLNPPANIRNYLFIDIGR